MRGSLRVGQDVYDEAKEVWKTLGFESLSDYFGFTVSLAHGRWDTFGFADAEEAADYLTSLMRGQVVLPPPHLRRSGKVTPKRRTPQRAARLRAPHSAQEALPVIDSHAAA
ncbi:hypothetical protein [Sinosporangium album]|uniref:hypothetical protein n=1 Tax=Sinosporangium album TaxID=504805 RepID=UPI000B8322A8|nr:hypothetical protein [Sinosporangium album]